ncbi:MAG: hypothetical protein EOP84_24685 [Verrucomicrobiaceae bacterium]|nr:MAG: hypothetical protein EOP84_24685 [Verrucomicrobiaceae bacterium]
MTTEERIAEHRRMIQVFEEAITELQEGIQDRRRSIMFLEQRIAESRSKATESPEPHEYPVGYRKSATGAMEPRTVDVRFVQGMDGRTHTVQKVSHGEYIAPAEEYRTYNPVGNTHRLPVWAEQWFNGTTSEPDIRIDPPYDR